jgi:molybdopterin synthase catalytic subunit
MRLHVLLFAGARELAGVESVVVDIPSPATAADVLASLANEVPALAPLIPYSRLAVDSRYASDAMTVEADQELALIPPVSGG